ncbi:MAG TPA: prolipoprotein diacylglyceryl transferase [Nevskiales bacterium]|nr:prolipoprotein diacylglyceryl transferase [Nevskiales bacterium]
MLTHPGFDPVALKLGPVAIHWYGLMYLIAFYLGWWLATRRARATGSGWTPQQMTDLLFYVVLGVILGGRIGYVLFYGFEWFVENPLVLFKIWEGGMSFHGGLLGVLAAYAIYARLNGRSFFEVADFLAPLYPIGLFLGRIGNFINAELWGRPTDLPWGMVFPNAGPEPRHPSQLYEAGLEGLLLFAILWWYSARPRPRMAVSALFALLYGLFRFAVEFAREPDAHLGYLAFGWLTMGMLLCLPMILIGAGLLWYAYRRAARVA